MKKNKNRLLTCATLFASATVIIHVLNKVIAASASLKEMLDRSQKNTFNWRFGKVSYTKRGKGDPILLIHDIIPGCSGYEWHKIEKCLAMKHTVYTIDLLGCGSSEKPGITYTNFVYTQLICDFVKKVIGEKTDVIASGFSSSCLLMSCRNEENLFNKLILVNPPSISRLNQMPEDKDKFLKFLLEIPVFGTFVYHIVASRRNICNQFIENLYYNPFHIDEDMVDAFYEAAHVGGPYAKSVYASYASKYMNININNALQTIDHSILIIEGESESNANAIIDNYCSSNSSIESVVIKKSKHFPHVENPEAFLEQVEIFL